MFACLGSLVDLSDALGNQGCWFELQLRVRLIRTCRESLETT